MNTSTEPTNDQQSPTGRLASSGKDAVEGLQRLIATGNARKLRVEREGRTLLEVPLTVGVVGTILAPHVAGLGAIAALLTGCSLTIEKPESKTEEPDTSTTDS